MTNNNMTAKILPFNRESSNTVQRPTETKRKKSSIEIMMLIAADSDWKDIHGEICATLDNLTTNIATAPGPNRIREIIGDAVFPIIAELIPKNYQNLKLGERDYHIIADKIAEEAVRIFENLDEYDSAIPLERVIAIKTGIVQKLETMLLNVYNASNPHKARPARITKDGNHYLLENLNSMEAWKNNLSRE